MSRASIDDWISQLPGPDARALLREAAAQSPEIHDRLNAQRAVESADPADLLEIVNSTLASRKRFYDYWQANQYASDAAPTVVMLAESADRATPAVIPVIERAITLTTRAILKSDDSSGAQGDVVRQLLEAHVEAVRSADPPLTQTEQTRLVKWLISYRYGGTQDFFDPDIVAYAPALTAKSLERYRQAIAGIDLGPYGRYPLTRLAVLDRDRDAIVAAHGGEPHNAMLAASIVWDLEEAGLHADALAYARRGVEMESRGWDERLNTFLVDDAIESGDLVGAVELRRDWFARFPTALAFSSFRRTAERCGVWEAERGSAERALAGRDATGFVVHLLDEGRDGEAWAFASERIRVQADPGTWLSLCERRAATHPAETLPVYRDIVTETLTITDKRNYRDAAKILKTMRTVADAADARAEFDAFLAETVERNRCRPTCLAAFDRAGLMRG